MPALNRTSMWTLNDGTKVPVKSMTLEHLDQANNYLDQMEMEERAHEPYLLEQLCETSDCCALLDEPEHKKDGFTFEDWRDVLTNELLRRFKTLQNGLYIPNIPVQK